MEVVMQVHGIVVGPSHHLICPTFSYCPQSSANRINKHSFMEQLRPMISIQTHKNAYFILFGLMSIVKRLCCQERPLMTSGLRTFPVMGPDLYSYLQSCSLIICKWFSVNFSKFTKPTVLPGCEDILRKPLHMISKQDVTLQLPRRRKYEMISIKECFTVIFPACLIKEKDSAH